MSVRRIVTVLGAWCYRAPLVRALEERWYRSSPWRLLRDSLYPNRLTPYRRHHLYEILISNDRMWFKLQASCWSFRQAAAFFEARFNGTRYVTDDGHRPVTPFRLSDCSPSIANWESFSDDLPEGWDDGEYRIERHAYPWCRTLAQGCDCYANKARAAVVCSAHGHQHEARRKRARTHNARHEHYIAELETRIASNDEAQRTKKSRLASRSPAAASDGVFVYPRLPLGQGQDTANGSVPATAMNKISHMASAGFYCSIDKTHHRYEEQPIRRTIASLNAACEQMSVLDEASRRSAMSHIATVAEHYLRVYQSEDCAQRSAWGNVDVPTVLYKYIPKELIGQGAPNSLRATQLLALNDDMECNVTTMKDVDQSMLDMLRVLRQKSKDRLGVDMPWDELLEQQLRYGSPRLSPYIQRYLNSLVGVVALTTDICVPTMWSHYAQNTGIVVGYDTEALRRLGFELQPVVYSELAPVYRPLSSDDIELNFVDREYMESVERTGQETDGLRLLTRAKLTEFGSDWRSLARLLFVKGMSWAYEKEVRLLVDLEVARDTGRGDGNGCQILVVDVPSSAIVEIYGGAHTREADLKRAVEVARGGDKAGLYEGRLSAHAYRIQRAGGTKH